MRVWSVVAILALGFAASCATTETSEEGPSDPVVHEVGAQGGLDAAAETSRAKTERRLQLERSVDQWWLARVRQEYGKSEGIASALETYVNDNFAEVVSDLSSASPRFRKVSAAALGFSGRQEAVDPLVTSLRDPFSDVIHGSLLSLWNLALAKIEIPAGEVTPYLSHSEEDIRSNAAMVLAQVTNAGQGALFLPLTSAMEDDSASVRVHAAAALGRLGDPDAIPFLVKGLRDQKALVRIRSAYALGRISDRRALGPLIDHLDDPDVDVSKAIHKSLTSITGQQIPRIKKEWEVYFQNAPQDEQ